MAARIYVLAIFFSAVLGFLFTDQAHAQTHLPGQLTRCFALPEGSSVGASPSHEQLAAVWGMDSIHYSDSLGFLSIDASEFSMLGLHQRLIPNDKGSTRSLVKWQLVPEKTYQLTQKIFLSPGFDWGGEYEGGKLGFGLGGGSAPTGGQIADDGFTARFMWRGNHDGTASLVVYSYASDRSQNLPYGDDLKLTNSIIPTGEWFEVTLEITTNSSPSEADGSVRAWFNGEPALSVNGIQWQSEGTDVVIDSLAYATFYGGNSRRWSPDYETYIRFADVCLTTSTPKQRI